MATIAIRTFYSSSNGDKWHLVREIETSRVFVRHEANLPSGGEVEDMDIGMFFITDHGGPQHQELSRLIGTLVPATANT
jgi:hypothetical protein